jgi:toxin FitB
LTSSGVTCDTSVLLPALLEWHDDHDLAIGAVDGQVTTMIGHALVETFSVGTRLPEPFRVSTNTMVGLLESLSHEVVTLSAARVLSTLRRMSSFGLGGGQTYDGLIVAAANEHDLTLLTLDRRARATYDALGGDVRYLR